MLYFLDDSGNFDNLVKILTRIPPKYYQNSSKNTRTFMESSWKHVIFVNLGLKHSKMFEGLYVPCKIFVDVCFRIRFRFLFMKKWLQVLKIVLWRWGPGYDTLSMKHICKSLDMNFISIKNIKCKFGKSSKLIYFQVRESLFFLFSRNVPKLFYFK